MHPTMVEMFVRYRQADMEREMQIIHLQRLAHARHAGMGRSLLGAAGRFLIHAGTLLNRMAGASLNGCPEKRCEN